MSEDLPEIPMPPHVYIPGLSPRHPDHLFDELKASVLSGMPANELHNTKAFIAGRLFYDGGYFWECYAVLEAVWRQTKDPSPERDMVLALIQLANARLKVLMLQPRAAMRLCDMVEAHLSRCPQDSAVLGLRVPDMLARVSEAKRIAKAAIETPY